MRSIEEIGCGGAHYGACREYRVACKGCKTGYLAVSQKGLVQLHKEEVQFICLRADFGRLVGAVRRCWHRLSFFPRCVP